MTTTINADNGVVSTIPGLKYSADSSGILVLQTNTTNALTLDASQNATFATGILATNPFAGSFSDGTVVDYTTGVGRITVGTSDDIAFYHNGIASRTEIARFTYTGRLGIGTATPSYALDVVSNSNGTIGARIQNSSSGSAAYSTLWLDNDSAGIKSALVKNSTTNTGNVGYASSFYMYYNDTGSSGIFNVSATPIQFWTNNAERMRITSAGYVGIGTNSPQTLFHVSGAVNTPIIAQSSNAQVYSQFTNSGGTAYVGSTGNALQFLVNAAGNEAMRIDTSGNVGIGTTSPVTTLDVSVAAASTQVSSTTGTNRVFSRVVNGSGNFYFGIDSSTGGLFGGGAYSRTIYADGAYPMVFYTNSAERMRIDSSGNVGIGTSSPSSYTLYKATFAVANGSGVGIQKPASGNNAYLYFGYDTTSPGQQQVAIGSISDTLAFFTQSTPRLTINSSGAFGVGSPAAYGTSGQVLTSQGSGSPPTWATAAGPAFSAYVAGATTSFSANTWTKVTLNTEVFDTNSNFDTTNYRFTPTVAGYYQISGGVENDYASTSAAGSTRTGIYKNGSIYAQSLALNSNATYNYGNYPVSVLVYMNGSTDYIELYTFSSAPTAYYDGGANWRTWMTGVYVRGA